ncbi:MAG: DUF4190 domain-containing protein [Ilumatobacter sp.]|uniref:DUF4190 domain-containing protein n=1 Tax=Ilumatobacter sp. TaxID=1967498 RepID=UPI0032984897
MSNLPPPSTPEPGPSYEPTSSNPPTAAWDQPTSSPSSAPIPPPPPGFSNDSGARNGAGTASLVLGILSIVTGLFVIGIVLGIVGLVLGIIGRKRAKRGEATNGGAALAGIITSIIGSLVSIAMIVFVVVLLSSGSFSSLVDCLDDAGDDPVAQDRCERDFEDDLFGG